MTLNNLTVGMWSTLLLSLLPGPLWLGVVAPDRVLSMGYYLSLPHQSWIKYYHYCSFTGMTLTWNADMTLYKEFKFIIRKTDFLYN